MYLPAFGLKRLPFRLRADPEFVYPDRAFAEAAAVLARRLSAPPAGLTVVEGPAGVGKSTLIEYALREAGERKLPLRLTQPRLSARELDQWLRSRRSDAAADESVDDTPRAPLLIVEHGERLPDATRQALLRLAGSAGAYRVLVEASEDAPGWPPEGRIGLAPFALESVAGYVEHRLRVAGSSSPSPFGEDACAALFATTRGTARLVNALCDLGLTLAAERGTRHLGAAEIYAASRDPRWAAFLAAESAAETESADAAEPADAASEGGDPPAMAESSAKGSAEAVRPSQADRFSSPRGDPGPGGAGAGTRRAIEVWRGERFLRLLRLPRGSIQVGRDRANDLRLESHYVSRRHCELLVSQDSGDADVAIIDSSSVNGILVNGRRVRRARLVPGDRIQVGDFELRLLAVDPPPRSSASGAEEERRGEQGAAKDRL